MKRYLRIIQAVTNLYNRIFCYPVATVSSVIDDEYWQKKLGPSIGMLSRFRQDRARIVGNLIDKNSVVVDLGAGDGAILEYLVKSKSVVPYAADCSVQMVERLKSLSFEVLECDLNDSEKIRDLPDADYYLALEIIEHLAFPEQLLKAITPKAKKGVIISIPNTGYFVHRLRLLFGRFPLQWIVCPGEHLRFWTLGDLKWWLKALGFRNYQVYCYQGIPVLNKVFPGLFAEGLIVKIKKS